MSLTRSGWGSLVSGALVVGLSLASVLLAGPPEPRPADAPATAFSAERAMVHVREIAQRPHPTGSAEHDRVRDYLVAAFERLGLPVERQAATVLRGTQRVRMARLENLMVRLAGSASTGAVLLASHYDCVPAGPGAADDGAGVAALLETARALKAGPALRNDVIVLLTDAEEFGMLGAQAFVDEHPWAKDVRVAVNFEARGSSGPSQMFETGPGNGAVVAEWASHVPAPAGSSLSYEVYKRLPNDTDFSEFKKLKVPGLNFAFIGQVDRYHTPGDSVAALDAGSVQHHGDAALALARRFGSLDLAGLRSGDAVYFSLPLVGVAAHYSTRWAVPLALAGAVLFAVVLVRARRRREASLGGVMLAALIFLVFVAASGWLGWRSGRLAGTVHSRWLPGGDVLMSGPYAAALVACIATVWLALYALLRRKFAAHSLALGALVVWAIAALASAWFLVGASYVLVWPLAGGALAAVALAAGPAGKAAGPVRALVISLLALPAILIVWPLVATLFCAMGLAPMSGAAMGVVTALGLGVLAVQTEVVAQGRRWWPAGIAALVVLASLAVAAAGTRYSDRHPKSADVVYVLDADARIANWTARADRPEPWLSQYLGEAPRAGRPRAFVEPWANAEGPAGFQHGDAPVVALPAPQAALLASVPSGPGRVVTFDAMPAREGDVLSVWVQGPPVIGVSIAGKEHPAPPGKGTTWSLDCINTPAAGVEIALTLKGPGPLTVAVVNRYAGLPEIPGHVYTPRPARLVPVQFGDQTVVRRTYVF